MKYRSQRAKKLRDFRALRRLEELGGQKQVPRSDPSPGLTGRASDRANCAIFGASNRSKNNARTARIATASLENKKKQVASDQVNTARKIAKKSHDTATLRVRSGSLSKRLIFTTIAYRYVPVLFLYFVTVALSLLQYLEEKMCEIP